MIHLSASLKYYKREDVQQAMVEHGKDKEVAARFNERFGKRPDTLTYPGDVLELAKNGATSFHCSEELWANPLLLQPQMPKGELDRMRKGWDLLLDIDTDAKDKEAGFEYSKIAADLIVKELKKRGVKNVTAKFSGNKGFHIAVPYEAFPKEVNGKEIRDEFPAAAKRIAMYLKEQIKYKLGTEILKKENDSFAEVAAKTGKNVGELHQKNENASVAATEKPILNAEPFLVIDTILISSRHMYRMPYSLHEKSGLASIPINPDNILRFSKGEAEPQAVKVGKYKFIDRASASPGEASKLFREAYDMTAESVAKDANRGMAGHYDDELDAVKDKIPGQYFPPCIKKMLEGVQDGRKRALFVLVNFLGSCNYGSGEIEEIVKEWNGKNREPLTPIYLATQLSYSRHRKEKVPPPNCDNASYYKELGIECTLECGRCKNPVAEAKQIYRRAIRVAEGQKPTKKELKMK